MAVDPVTGLRRELRKVGATLHEGSKSLPACVLEKLNPPPDDRYLFYALKMDGGLWAVEPLSDQFVRHAAMKPAELARLIVRELDRAMDRLEAAA